MCIVEMLDRNTYDLSISTHSTATSLLVTHLHHFKVYMAYILHAQHICPLHSCLALYSLEEIAGGGERH